MDGSNVRLGDGLVGHDDVIESLDGSWRMAVVAHRDFETMEATPSSCAQVEALDVLEARVPGNFELDLERTGRIPDPFYGLNALALQAYEDCHVFYARRFHYHAQAQSDAMLRFEGIDTIADIYLNGERIAHTDNMFVVHTLPAVGVVEGENELVVHLRPVCLETRSYDYGAGHLTLTYNHETLRLRKAAHMFGWDIMPRLVSAGLYRSVSLWHRPRLRLRQCYLMTRAVDVERRRATLELFYDCELGAEACADYRVRIEGHCGASHFATERRLWHVNGRLEVEVEDAQLWWPRGYGEAALYDVEVSLLRGETLVDRRCFQAGLRTVRLVRTSLTDEELSGDFHFEVNGRRVFLQGSNWVPVDAYHSRDVERIPAIMDMVLELNCNVLRCWGGNVYEHPSFYEACDRHGIAV